eukprot:3108060-Rhodomonas_salina.1
MPECNLALTQCAIQLALAPKCTAAYQAWKAAEQLVKTNPLYPVPLHLRNANSKVTPSPSSSGCFASGAELVSVDGGQVLSDLGWGQGYKYNPDYPDGAPDQTYLPPELQGHSLVPLPALRAGSPAL